MPVNKQDGTLLALFVECHSVLCFREKGLGLLLPPCKSRSGSLMLLKVLSTC